MGSQLPRVSQGLQKVPCLRNRLVQQKHSGCIEQRAAAGSGGGKGLTCFYLRSKVLLSKAGLWDGHWQSLGSILTPMSLGPYAAQGFCGTTLFSHGTFSEKVASTLTIHLMNMIIFENYTARTFFIIFLLSWFSQFYFMILSFGYNEWQVCHSQTLHALLSFIRWHCIGSLELKQIGSVFYAF